MITQYINTKILLSAAVILAAAAVVVGATFAFFSDTETSTANTFAAGDIDLRIDNESYALDFNIPDFDGTPVGNLVANPANSWTLTDLTTEQFFSFTDLKPGDYGEDTISIHVGSNDAWVCAATQITDDNDVSYSEPELGDDSTVDEENPTTTDGELDEEVNFAFWADDGDNVYENDETIFLGGPIGNLGGAGQIALADATGDGPFGNTPIPGTEGDEPGAYIGKIWCFGDLQEAPVAQGDNSPLGGTGFTCDGASVNNAAQTDFVEGDIQFFAVQARNNPDFSCAEDYDPVWPQQQPE